VRNEKPALVFITPARSMQAISTIADLAQNSSSSIAFLSPSNNRAVDKVLYLRAGADDFITEPFSPLELRARAEALIRRSGRRLLNRDSALANISADELKGLEQSDVVAGKTEAKQVIRQQDKSFSFDQKFSERLARSIDTVSKFDLHFGVYWLKGDTNDKSLNQQLARLCRQEDVVCRNANGEFVALLAGTDDNGMRGFETRLQEQLGNRYSTTKHGYSLYTPGESIDEFKKRALSPQV
jgi:PleD family two-component response regulator